jgi:HK97 family phage portal protein
MNALALVSTMRRNMARSMLKSSFNSGDWVSSSLPGNRSSSMAGSRSYYVPGSGINWANVKGDLWACPAAQACMNWIFRNGPQAPPIIQQRDAKGEWTVLPDHPLQILLERPNPQYDWSILFQQWKLSDEAGGDGYFAIERDGGGNIAELWWLPHNRVEIRTLPQSGNFIDFYQYWDARGFPHQIAPEDMLHIRYGLDPYDPRHGMSPTASIDRDIYSLQRAITYRANILNNSGAVGAIFTSANTVDNNEWDPKEVVAYYNDKVTGDQVGSPFGIDANLNITFPKNSPQDMQMATIEDRPEASVCAVIGVPAQVAGVHVGREAKTYANMKEAKESAWEEKLMPDLNRFACQAGHVLLPQYIDVRDPFKRAAAVRNLRVAFDYSNVRPLQPDLDALHERARRDWLANLLTLAEWCAAVGRPDPDPAFANMRFRDFAVAVAPGQINPTTEGVAKGVRRKADAGEDWAQRVIAEMEAIHAEGEEGKQLVVSGRNGVH